jgi:hypothetical protein
MFFHFLQILTIKIHFATYLYGVTPLDEDIIKIGQTFNYNLT